LAPLFTIIGWAFALNAATGALLFMADATAKSTQVVFFVKLMLIGLALWDTLLLRRRLSWDPAWLAGARSAKAAAGWSDPARAAWPEARLRRLASASLILWTGAITAGRLMAYL